MLNGLAADTDHQPIETSACSLAANAVTWPLAFRVLPFGYSVHSLAAAAMSSCCV